MAVKKSFVLNEPPMQFDQMADRFEDDVKFLVDDNISVPLQECCRILNKTDGAMCPLTITLYRSIAFKKLKMNL